MEGVVNGLRKAVARRVRGLAPGRQFRLELARRTIESFAGDRPIHVLDAGCEDGLLAATLARRHPDWTVVGADINDDALERARAAAGRGEIDNVEYAHVDITQPFASGTYDVVAAIECLAEIPDDRAALAAMSAALTTDGLFVTHVPERSWTPVLPGSPTSWKREARHGYGEDELRTLLEDVGLDRIEIRPTTRVVLHAAEELRSRTKSRSLKVRSLVHPLLVVAARSEQLGLTGGTPRGLFVTARRSGLAP
jgi:SAM-dependent methyltransferase